MDPTTDPAVQPSVNDEPPFGWETDPPSVSFHSMAGRLSNGTAWRAGGRDMVTFCRCGLAFYGLNVQESDRRWREHVEGT